MPREECYTEWQSYIVHVSLATLAIMPCDMSGHSEPRRTPLCFFFPSSFQLSSLQRIRPNVLVRLIRSHAWYIFPLRRIFTLHSQPAQLLAPVPVPPSPPAATVAHAGPHLQSSSEPVPGQSLPSQMGSCAIARRWAKNQVR